MRETKKEMQLEMTRVVDQGNGVEIPGSRIESGRGGAEILEMTRVVDQFSVAASRDLRVERRWKADAIAHFTYARFHPKVRVDLRRCRPAQLASPHRLRATRNTQVHATHLRSVAWSHGESSRDRMPCPACK